MLAEVLFSTLDLTTLAGFSLFLSFVNQLFFSYLIHRLGALSCETKNFLSDRYKVIHSL